MRIKSYFVKSVDEAMAQARLELGEDALLLSTRKQNSSDGGWSGYEVVFGCVDSSAPALTEPAAESPAVKPEPVRENVVSPIAVAPVSHHGADTPLHISAPAVTPIAPPAAATPLAVAGRTPKPAEALPDLEMLRAQMDEIHGLLLSSAKPQATTRGLPLLDGVFARLSRAGFSAALARPILDGVAEALAAMEPHPAAREAQHELAFDLLRLQMGARIKINAELGVKSSGGAVIAMVGPCGAGKTSLLMKIAAFQASPTRPVRLLTLDSSGLAGRLQLQFFAGRTGIAFSAVETPEQLPGLIQEARGHEIVLIDTPGYQTPAEREKLAAALARSPGVDVHLVLPGYMSATACREAIRKYGAFWPSKLAVTRLDETTTLGTLVSEAARAGLSLSLVSDGVSIPESLHAASIDDLVAIAMGPELAAEAACA